MLEQGRYRKRETNEAANIGITTVPTVMIAHASAGSYKVVKAAVDRVKLAKA